WDRTDDCTSVPHVALEHLGRGLLFETYREGRRYRWRIVLGSAAPVGDFFDALADEVGACAGMEVLRLTELDPEGKRVDGDVGDDEKLPAEQRVALSAAVEHGYYETPREIDLDELANELDIPRSTLSYRLRRAEAALATSFVERVDALDVIAPAE
ncbi:helix-turn-helix domain-containing protein, partial [Halovivax sp.]|uniref:helix-turn-helix domain-containing protein n=1 Tax=Halovivax sp. TaxID=1935978 RepID=UPI0025C5F398